MSCLPFCVSAHTEYTSTVMGRMNRRISGGGYGIHWPDIDEDLSTEGLLRGAPRKAIA